jgi:hypothetical protein
VKAEECWESHHGSSDEPEKKGKEKKGNSYSQPCSRSQWSGCGELENEIYQRHRVQQVIKLSSLPAKKRGGRDKAARSPSNTSLQKTHMRHTTPIVWAALYYSHRQLFGYIVLQQQRQSALIEDLFEAGAGAAN